MMNDFSIGVRNGRSESNNENKYVGTTASEISGQTLELEGNLSKPECDDGNDRTSSGQTLGLEQHKFEPEFDNGDDRRSFKQTLELERHQ